MADDRMELRYHNAMPGWCKIIGLKIKAIHECEGGGFAIEQKQAEAIVKALSAPATPSEGLVEGQLTVRNNDVRALQEDVFRLMKVVRCAESAVVTVKNDLAREKLSTVIRELPTRLKTRISTPATSRPEQEGDQAYGYLSRLFVHCAPRCEPLPTLMGLCTQIDNLIVGLKEKAAPPPRSPSHDPHRSARRR